MTKAVQFVCWRTVLRRVYSRPLDTPRTDPGNVSVEAPIRLYENDPSFEALYAEKQNKTTNRFYYQNLALASLNNADEPRLEELFEPPPLSSSAVMSLSRQKLSSLKEFQIPVSESQIERTLGNEFQDMVFKTDWDAFAPQDVGEAEARRLVVQRFVWEQLQEARKPPTSNIPYAELPKTPVASKRIEEECGTVENEMKTGDYSRHQPILDECILQGRTYSDGSMSVLRFAAKTLGRNPSLHPVMKTKTLSIIAEILGT